MESKTLKIKRVFAWTIYDNLRKIPPKNYPTTAEIRSTLSDILPAIKPFVDDYTSILKKADDLREDAETKKNLEGKEKENFDLELKSKIEALNDEWKAYNKAKGIEIVDIVLSSEGLKTLKTQFDRDGWGNQWLGNIEEFGELLEAFKAAEAK